MNPLRSSVLILVALASAACSTQLDYLEFEAGDRTFEEAWMAFDQIARADGYIAGAGTDRGLKVYESRWRELPLPFRKGGRKRVRAEFEDDPERGWVIRYAVQTQIVEDMRYRLAPKEEDWEDSGQDQATEQRFARKLQYRFRTSVENANNTSR